MSWPESLQNGSIKNGESHHLEAYAESMEACISSKNAVPQWYLAMEEDMIVGGLGVIENDFHDRKDL